MSIVIFGDLFSFPDGNAATNRLYTYAKGFIENGIKVHVVCFLNEYSDKYQGNVEGIEYYYPFQQKARSKSFFMRRWQNFLKHVRTYRIIKKINKEDKIIAINAWTNLLKVLFFIWLISRLFRIKVITECSEHPLRMYQGGRLNRTLGKIKFYFESRLCDGILCISRYLVDFHEKRGIKKRKLFLVPSTVEPSRFNVNGQKPVSKPYVGYFGSLTFKRDNVDFLINSFAKFSQLKPDVQLVLGGYCTDDMRKEINDLIDKLNIAEKVTVINYLPRQEIVKYISYADALVMTRSRDLESKASYPSKLTEFLATGKPVISVNVGEVSDFLVDAKNAFLVEPGDIDSMAAKLDYIFTDYDSARNVGLNGKKLTETVFNYNYQAKRIIDYIHFLNK